VCAYRYKAKLSTFEGPEFNKTGRSAPRLGQPILVTHFARSLRWRRGLRGWGRLERSWPHRPHKRWYLSHQGWQNRSSRTRCALLSVCIISLQSKARPCANYSLRRLAIYLVRSAFLSTIPSRPLVTTAATRGFPRRISLQASFRYVVGNFSVSSSAQRPAPCPCELCPAAGFLRRREIQVSQRPLPLVLCCEVGASSSVLTHVPLSLLPTPPSCARASTGSHRPRPRP